MTPERWQEVKALLAAALELQGEARARLLERAGAADPALRLEVEDLLAGEGAAGALTATVVAAAAAAEAPSLAGTLVGPYRLEAEIGRGGMGAVYLASRADGQYDARVAVKLARPDLDGLQTAGRFRRERQYLAALEHPYIARLLDGGVSAEGRLYLVLEYVDGVPIDAYCEAQGLDLEARLRLLHKVCAAVEYAHQHLIVHRDLKPSNVLVRPDGTPKLVDFGIAKLLGQEPADGRGGPTLDASRFLTPGYASPEHRAGGPITTASDVFSLGVLLHEVLAGCLPLPRPGNQEPGGQLGESLPVSAAAARERAPGAPASGVEPRRLRGDVDRIVAKALRVSPDERYRSVAGLGEDLRRVLDREPILARPPTLRDLAWKWVRRNRALAAALTAASLLAAAGVAATVWEGRRATVARAAAERAEQRARRRFEEVRRLAHAVIYDYSGAIERLSGSIEVRERLVQDALTYLDSLAADAGEDAGLQAELAEAYVKIGDIQGNIAVSNMGRGAEAERSYRKAAALYEALDRAAPQDAAHQLAMAGVWIGPIAYAAWSRNDVAGALAAGRRGSGILEALDRHLPGDGRVRALQVQVEENLSNLYLTALADVSEARRHTERGCQLERSGAGTATRPRLEAEVAAAYCDNYMGLVLSPLGERREAVAHWRAAVGRTEQLVREYPDDVYRKVDLAVFLSRLAADLADGEAGEEALQASRRAVTLMTAVVAQNGRNGAARYRMSQILRTHARLALDRGLGVEASAASTQALELARELDAASAGVVTYVAPLAAAEVERGEVLERQGDRPGALRLYREAAEALNRLTSAPEHLQGRWHQARARALAARLVPGEAGLTGLREAVAAMEAVAARDVASVAKRRELARWHRALAALEGVATPARAAAALVR